MTLPRAEIAKVRELVNAILDDGPTPERLQQLERLLNHDPEVCEAYLDFMTMHAYLERQLGGSLAEVPGVPGVTSQQHGRPRRIRIRRHAIAAVLVILGVLIGVHLATWLGRKAIGSTYVATLKNAINAQWSMADAPQRPGSLLKQGSLVLTKGLAEIELFEGTVLTLEGPVGLELLSTNRIALEKGMLVAEIPTRATGFAIRTQVAEIVDLGTRVGVKADTQGTTWVRVFDGKVRVSPSNIAGRSQLLQKDEAVTVDGKSGALQPVGASTLQFPHPARAFNPDLQGGFEPNDLVLSTGIPNQVGRWSGDMCAIVGTEQGVTPHSGQRMLKFIATTAPGDRPMGITGASQQWRIFDLSDIRDQVRAGYGVLEASVYFNRVASRENRMDIIQGLSVHAFKGRPGAPNASERHIRSLNAQINTDNNPKTWERVELTYRIPFDADYLVLELRTAINVSTGRSIREFEGHYADDLICTMRVGPTAARAN